MDKSLYRSDTFPYPKDKKDSMNYHAIETLDGWYTVSVDLDTDDFILTTPEARQVADCLKEIHFREQLYLQYEDGMIYKWLKEVQDKITKWRSRNGETHTWFKVLDLKYFMRVNVAKEQVLLTIPKQTRMFDMESMYINNADLPLIQDGALDDAMRKKLEHQGLELQKTPYKVGLGLTQKITNKQ
jgi:hypothetical protein